MLESGSSRQGRFSGLRPRAFPVPTPDEIQQGLEKVLADERFLRSGRLSRFLRFAVEKTLAGEADQLKEYHLGLEVFGRDETYDPRIDPIVRVEARRLRTKLEDYYRTAGQADPICFRLPKGSYVPVFEQRDRDRSPGEPPPGIEATARPAAPPHPSSLLVLPFVTLSSDPETEYFSDGLTEELIDALAQIKGIKVTSRTSAFAFKGKQQDIREIGARLRVRLVLEGSVRAAGRRLRVTTRLVDVAEDAQLWSEQYDREFQDVFEIQKDISAAIVRVLKIRLSRQETKSLVRQKTEHLKAYSLYIRGREFWNQRAEGGLEKGVHYFEQAVQDDPNYASAYAGLAECYGFYELYTGAQPQEFMPKARQAAQRALELDAALSEAHTSAGMVGVLYDWNWQDALRHFERAIDLSPNYPTAHHWYGHALLAQGRCEEALEEFRFARDVDPLSPLANASIGAALYFARRYEQALDQLTKTLVLSPSFELAHLFLGRTLLQRSRSGDAVVALTRAREYAGNSATIGGELGVALAMAGKDKEARSFRNGLAKGLKNKQPLHYPLALLQAAQGEPEEALQTLEQAVEGRSYWAHLLGVDPLLDGLRENARFAKLLGTVGLAFP